MLNKLNLSVYRVLGSVFPIVQWSRSYDVTTLIGDLIAGVTVALTLIPQSIAYASLAGLEPQYGLYASFAGGFIYAIKGTIPQINIGPTALLSLLTFTYTNGTNPDFAILLCLIGGIVQLLAGIAQLGFLVDFVSLPVVSGFTSAAAITIASSQIKGLLGLRFNAESFVATWRGIFQHIAETRLPDTLLSFGCCILLIGMKAVKDIRLRDPENQKEKSRKLIIQRTLWFVGVARNTVIVILAAILAYFIHETVEEPLLLTGHITPGLPMPQVPYFSTNVGNTTFSTGEMFSHLGMGLLVVPLVGIIANVAIAKAFCIIVLLTLVLLTPYFYYIPRAALSAVIICAVLHMVDIQIVKNLWRTSKLDLIPLFGSFVLCLGLGIELGIVCGVCVDVLLLLYYHSKPPLDIHLVDDGTLPPYYTIHLTGGLHFPSAERVRIKLSSLRNPSNVIVSHPTINIESITTIQENNESPSNEATTEWNRSQRIVPNGAVTSTLPQSPHVLVIRCDSLERIDYTFLQSLKLLVSEWARDGRVVWCGLKTPLRQKLIAALQDPVFCDTIEDLRNILIGTAEEQHLTNDTQL